MYLCISICGTELCISSTIIQNLKIIWRRCWPLSKLVIKTWTLILLWLFQMIFSFTEDDKVLFVGEGNFSFSASLVKYLADHRICRNFSNVIISCYEASDDGSGGERTLMMSGGGELEGVEAGSGGQGDTCIEAGGGGQRDACTTAGGGGQRSAFIRAGGGGQRRECTNAGDGGQRLAREEAGGGGQRSACMRAGGGGQTGGATRELLERSVNMEFLRSRGCSVLEGLDGQKLDEDERLGDRGFTLVVFMFPHIGGKMKIGRNRALLLGFLKSCMQVQEEKVNYAGMIPSRK